MRFTKKLSATAAAMMLLLASTATLAANNTANPNKNQPTPPSAPTKSLKLIPAVPAAANNTQTKSNMFSPEQVKDIQKIIHDYLVKNPKVLLEASQALQKQAAIKAQKTALAAIAKNKKQLFHDAATPTAGNPNGDVVIVEFFDYQCGHCKEMNPIIISILKQDKDVQVVFKELPIFGANSTNAAKAALASIKQGKYLQFHEAMLAAKNPLTPKKVMTIAKKVGLNINQLKKDMALPATTQQIRDNFKLAEKLKLVGTPAFVIANKASTTSAANSSQPMKVKFIPGSTSQANMQQQIDAVK